LYPSNLIQLDVLWDETYSQKKLDGVYHGSALSIISPVQSMDYSRRFHWIQLFWEGKAK